ncbi:hypothetical protein RNP08_21160, partial [Escherichia coli]|nr:hypothetical protein [Escherichia coli]
SLKTSIKTITYLSDIGCLEIQGASLVMERRIKIQDTMILTMKLIVSGEIHINIYLNNLTRD